MRLVEDFEVVDARKKELARFFEGYAVRLPIREVLGIIPDNLHSMKVYANSPYW